MRFWTHIAFLFLVRSGRATALLSIMVITAVSALIFLSALAVGVNDAMLRNTVGLFSGHITGHKLAASVRPEDLMVKGVKGVLKRVYMPGVLSNGNRGQPLMICGIDPRRETALTALQKKIGEGSYPQAGHFELLISKPLAEELGAQRGADLVFTSPSHGSFPPLIVSGIYQTHIDLLDREIAFCPLDVLPETPLPWSAAIFLQNGINPQEIINVYRQKWSEPYRFESWETMMPDLRQLIDLEYISMGIVIILVFGVVSVGIACSFVIFIIKNIREYGIMKAMGVTTREMSVLIVMKVVLMNVIACGIGLLIGSIAVWGIAETGGIDITAFTSHNRYFTVSGIIYPRLTDFSLFAPLLTSFLFSLIAAVWPVALLTRRKTADIMRMI
ncbi:MAG: ABC transporter permease [Deltaproteobacteria bacterium]|nr:ABC transporter permease [Deltaproteobacteria bacterium]